MKRVGKEIERERGSETDRMRQTGREGGEGKESQSVGRSVSMSVGRSDHAPGKTWTTDYDTRVPLALRVPARWRHLIGAHGRKDAAAATPSPAESAVVREHVSTLSLFATLVVKFGGGGSGGGGWGGGGGGGGQIQS